MAAASACRSATIAWPPHSSLGRYRTARRIRCCPTRYPGSESSEDNQIRLARKTEWLEKAEEVYLGLGQRMLATNEEEFPLMAVREIRLGPDASASGQ